MTPRGSIIKWVIKMNCYDNCHKTKHRTEDEKKYLKKRLRTINGQINGIINMIDDDRYCNDILIQMSAVEKSLKSISNKILENHLSTCVVDDIKEDKLEIIQEVMNLIKTLE